MSKPRSRLDIGLTVEHRAALETMLHTINQQRAAKGLAPATMRQLILSMTERVAAMPSAFLCGELIHNGGRTSEA